MGFGPQQFSHFIGIPIDASQQFITEHSVGEADCSVTSFLQCLAQGQGKKGKNKKSISGFKSTDYATSCPKIKSSFGFKSTNSMLAVLNYGCMFSRLPVLHPDRD